MLRTYQNIKLSDKEIEERAKITLKTANVTGQSTDAVSEQLTSIWNGYKVNAEEAELYIDRVAAVAATTASDLEELATGMSKVASAAATMGVNEEQLAAQLSTIISVTRQAPESVGTALRTVYARISDIEAGIDEEGVSLGNYSEKMAKLGFNVLDMNGNLRDMGEVIEEIGNSWDDLTREQQVSLAQTMAGQRQYSNLIALFDNFEQYNEALATAQNAAGTLQKQQDTYMESTKAHLQVLKASVEDVYTSLIDTDSINGLIDGLTSVTGLVNNFIDSIGGGGGVLRALGSIGVTVFSEQIAKGLNNTIMNMERAKNNAMQFEQALQATRNWQGIPELDETTRQLLNSREQLLELSRLMSPEQFSGMQELLNNITQLGNKIASLKEQKAAIDQLIESIMRLEGQSKTANEVMGDEGAQSTVLEHLQKQEIGWKNLTNTIKEYLKTQTTAAANPTQGGGDMAAKIAQAQAELDAYIQKFKALGDENLSQSHIAQIEKIKTQIAGLSSITDPGTLSSKIQEIAAQLAGIARAASAAATSSRQSMETEFGGGVDAVNAKLQETQQQLDATRQKFENMKGQFMRGATIQNFAQMAGGIAQVGSAIMQVQNLGSIWKNADLSTGEKLLQTITNLAMSLPMLISGFGKAATAMGLLKTVTAEQAAQMGILSTAQQSQAVAFLGIGTAAEGAAIKIKVFNSVLSVNPILAVITAITAAIGVIGAIANAVDEANQKYIQAQQAEIEAANKQIEHAEKTRDLANALDDLNTKYESGNITRAELKSTLQDLVDQYGLEGQAADNLTHSYDNLSEAILKARQQAAEEGAASAKRALTASRNEVNAAARQDSGFKGLSDQYSLYIHGGGSGIASFATEPKKIQEILKQAGGNLNASNVSFKTDFNTESIIELYDALYSAREQMQALREEGELTDAQLSDSQYYKNTVDWLDKMSDSVERYRKAQQDTQDYTSQLLSLQAQTENNIDFSVSAIDGEVSKYIDARNALIQALQEQGVEEPMAAADQYLQKNFESIYNQFDEAAAYVEKMRGQLGFGPPTEQMQGVQEAVESLIGRLDNNQWQALMSLDSSTITSWQSLAEIIFKISTTDFSNLQGVIGGAEAAQQKASQQFTFYQSLQDQISGGKNISKTEFESLTPQLQEYFDMTANGTYKLVSDATEFYNIVNDLKLDGFRQAFAEIQNELDSIGKIQNGSGGRPIEYEDITKSAYQENPVGNSEGYVNQRVLENQLNYLDAVAETGSVLDTQVDLWKEVADTQGLSAEQLDDIADAVSQVGDHTQDLQGQAERLKDLSEEVASQMHDAMFPVDEDVDLDLLQDLSEALQDMADQSEELSDELIDNQQAADDLAQAILRFDDACVDVTENYEDWMAALESGAIQDSVACMDDLRDAYADVLDLDGSSLSDDFLRNTENLDLMKAAIQGNSEAYDELLARAGQDILMQVGIDPSRFYADKQMIEDAANNFIGQDWGDIEIGASLNDERFLAACEEMVNAAGMTAEQATDYLASMGVDAEVVENDTEATERKEMTGWQGEWLQTTGEGYAEYPIGVGPNTKKDQIKLNFVGQQLHFIPDKSEEEDVKENKAFSLKVTSAKKSSGGGFKYSQASHGGGNSGNHGSGGSNSGGGGKGKGGNKGGGSSKTPKPNTSQKNPLEKLEDERNIFRDIDIVLEKLNRRLERTQKLQDRLYGKDLIDNLNKQQRILEKQRKLTEEKLKIQKQDLSNQRKELQNLGVTFDKYGDITNYMELMEQKRQAVNAAIEQENKLIEQYNASTDDAVKEELEKQIEEADKKREEAQKAYDTLQEGIEKYDTDRDNAADLVDAAEELLQQQIEIQIKKFNMEVEIRLDMGQAQRDWNKFKREVLNHTDVVKDTDFDKLFGDANLDYEDLYSYFDVHGTKGSLQASTEQLQDVMAEIGKLNATGHSDIYGDNKAKAMEDLDKYLNEVMTQLEDMKALIDAIDEAYLDTIDDVKDNFDKQIDDYEFIGELFEHDMNLLELVYGEKNYDAMDKYYTSMQENNLKELDSLKKQKDYWKQLWDEALAKGDTQAAKKFEENYKETISNLNSLVEESAQLLRDKYVNAVDKIFDELNKKVTNGTGLDYLSTQWDLANRNADEYLDTVNSAFAIQETERKYQKAIDDAKNIKSQQRLRDLMEEQLAKLRDKDKLTQYDVERAERMLEIEQARLALEDAQTAKTKLRLKRDSQGNYSYQYMADDEKAEQAESNLDQLQNDLYNFDKERYRSNLDDILSAWSEFQEQYKDILLDTSLTEEERLERLALLRDQYGEYINNKLAENESIRENLTQSAFADLALIYQHDVENYENMTQQEKQAFLDMLGTVDENFGNMSREQQERLLGLMSSVSQGFKDMTLDEQETFLQLLELAKNGFENMTEGQKQTLFSMLDSMDAGFASMTESEKESFVQMLANAKDGFTGMTDVQRDAFMGELVPMWDSGVQHMADTFAGSGGFLGTCEDAFEQLDQATQDYKNELDDMADAAGIDLDDVKSGVDNLADSFSDLVENNDDLIDRMTKEMDAISQLRDLAHELWEQYKDLTDAAIEAAQAAHELQMAEQAAAAAAAQREKQNMLEEEQWTPPEPEDENIDFEPDLEPELPKQQQPQQPSVPEVTRELAEGIAGNIWNVQDGGWENDPVRHQYMIDKWGQVEGERLYQMVQSFFNDEHYGYDKPFPNTKDYYRKFSRQNFRSGGYTGVWGDDLGRMAMLHQKEMVLNQSDTKNLLNTVSILRSVMSSLGGSVFDRMSEIKNGVMNAVDGNGELEQNVHIDANFPNVDSKREIEEAFADLVNLAAQRAMRNKR